MLPFNYLTLVIKLLLLLGPAQALQVPGKACTKLSQKYAFKCSKEETPGVLYPAIHCLCTYPPMLGTVLYCLEEIIEDESDLLKQYKDLLTYCQVNGFPFEATTVEYFQEAATNATKYLQTPPKDKKTKSTSPLKIPRKKVMNYYRQLQVRAHQEAIGENFGGAIMAYFALVLVLQGTVNLFVRILPRWTLKTDNRFVRMYKRFVWFPATPRFISSALNIHRRSHLIIIAGHLILSFVFMFTNYPTELLDAVYDTKEIQLAYLIGIRSGYLAVLETPLFVLFAGKNNLLLWLTGWSLDKFLLVHKWIGRTTVIHAIIHGSAMTHYFILKEVYAEDVKDTYMIAGIVATVAGGIILVQGTKVVRKRMYEIFLVTHILLALAWIIGAYYHLKLKNYASVVYFEAACGLWGFDRFARLVRLLFNGRSKARMILHDDGPKGQVIEFQIAHVDRPLCRYQPGNFGFMYMKDSIRFWQSHPFSVMDCVPDKEGSNGVQNLRIFARVKGGITKTMQQKLLKTPDRSMDVSICLEGPYGVPGAINHYESVLLFAGGSGITALYPYASRLKRLEGSQQRMTLVWIVPARASLGWMESYLNYIVEDSRISVKVYTTRESSAKASSASDSSTTGKSNEGVEPPFAILSGRPNVQEIINECISLQPKDLAVMTCGHHDLTRTVCNAVAATETSTSCKVDIIDEPTTW